LVTRTLCQPTWCVTDTSAFLFALTGEREANAPFDSYDPPRPRRPCAVFHALGQATQHLLSTRLLAAQAHRLPPFTAALRLGALALLLLALLFCGAAPAAPPAEAPRPHDARTYQPTLESSFAAAPGLPATFRWAGILEGAAYRIEVPQRGWNGRLLMWAHGYVGRDPRLLVEEPIMRRYLIQHGFAWAASSYHKNHYDVRAGVEDTNALAQAFANLAAANGQLLSNPHKIYIAGASMGGHVAAAAVERETLARAHHRVPYAGVLSMCGVLGDSQLFDYFAAYALAALQLAGFPAQDYPVPGWDELVPAAQGRLWTNYPTQRTEQGRRLRDLAMNLSGGARPFFAEAFADFGMQESLWHARDATLDGVLNASVVDTRAVQYRFGDPAAPMTPEEAQFNDQIARARPAPDANRLRRDGLRWIPVLAGEFDVPVLTLHTLGDLYVPLLMEQIYRRRAQAHGRGRWLVQRVVRDVGHCAFTPAEASEAFADLVRWVDGGPTPAGDDVLDPKALAAPEAGCRFTRNLGGSSDSPMSAARAAAQAHYPTCSAAPSASRTEDPSPR
jgi:hypothetical protein